MTLILGISAFYHDSAVALIRDGEVIAAASEERFTRKKHDEAFPMRAMHQCLEMANANAGDLDYVGFYEKPLLKFDRLLETYLAYAPRGYGSFFRAMPSWLQTKLHLPRELRKHLGDDYKRRIVFCEHHESHAASAFFPSPFDEAAILTVDGVGEWATTSWGIGNRNQISLKHEIRFPHSLGLLYSAFTYFCGFRVNSGEYKLMGLAPYGEPRFADLIREHLIELHDDGSYRLNMDYFSYCHKLRMTDGKLERLLGVKRRKPEQKIREVDMDIAASIQRVTEDVVLAMANHIHQQTKLDSLCMAGGVALNCVANGRLLREGPFKNIWVQPAAGDAGGALGVAWLIWHQLLGNSRDANPADAQSGSLLGPITDRDLDLRELRDQGAVMQHLPIQDELDAKVASLLAEENVVGWVQGPMEFGPRSLGSRSILGDPRSDKMQSVMNLKIKYRESFRPFAPSILEEHCGDYFEIPDGTSSSPYMLFTFDVQQHRRKPVDTSVPPGIQRVQQSRSDLPAITHLDYSARVQTVSRSRHPRFHSLLTKFYDKTGCPAVINTSFNVRGEPIVCSAADAYRCFMATEMDALVVGEYLMLKKEQPESARRSSEQYLTQLDPD
ncbi:Decarbamoylnovobiocin carbamoyltransferase [Rubripirellula obstinata]|uniref:Decarbamoylnovobiocin carbamoyltransferase n=1 Tax=Rubripirellula obstinata TaxID=406547 RepID=A0A5B1CEV3_9BACT|nr:carbamoyltransferase [Rubripirellula obstinata]KAA1258405.1 Decarbamoylnovobiocin carbamoyltransferase [Rubripirellula obstinata]